MKPPYRILHVMSRLPVGGVEQQLLNVIRNYDRAVISPAVVSLADKGQIGREIEAEGVEVMALGLLGHQFSWRMVSELKRIIKERGIDILRTHQYHANLYGRLAGAHVPCVVASVHNQYTQDRKLHRRLINHYLARRTDGLVAVSEAVKADIARYDRIAPAKIAVIPNGVDTAAIARGDRTRARRSLGISSDAQVIGAVGRLVGQKGHRYLVEALGGMKDTHPKAIVLLVGDGELQGELEDIARDFGIAERVVFAGMRRDVPDMLAAMDIYAMPSLWEGMSNALIEAMASGRPIVASAIPSFADVLVDGADALIVPPSDARALGDAISALLDDVALSRRLGDAAALKAEVQYSIRATVERYVGLYTSILQGQLP